MSGGRQVDDRNDGGKVLDYTANGCQESRAWTTPG
jgi:hypothetical protein